MFFNRKGINQKNWRMIKKGKHFLFGCTLFLATGAVMIQNPYLVHADEKVASLNDSTKAKDEDPNSDKVPNDVENYPQVENRVKESDKISENVQEDKSVEKAVENTVKAVNKTALNELIEKIRNTDLQNKTVKSVENLNLSLSRAQAVLDKEGVTQDEINKEVQVLSDSFAQLEEKSNDIDKKEKQADKANDSDEKKKLLTEKIAKVQDIVSEINQLAGEISYEFSESESKSLQAFGDLSEEKSTDSEVDGVLNEAKSLRNKVANRVTRAHSGKRDPRNGKPMDGKGESGFRGVIYTHKENRRNGNLIENGSTAVYYNSDEIWSLIEIKGERVGNERKFTTYVRGRIVEDVTPYYIVTVGFTGNSPIKGLKMQVAYYDKQAGKAKGREIEYGRTEINNPSTNAAIRGVVGEDAIVQPGRYEVHIASNTRVAPNQLKPYTFTFIIKPQSERNTVKDLSQTYVDDVRHLTENEKTALIEKFKTEHPDVMKPSGHKSDFDHAEVSADGATMTIHFKDGFNPKTIQTNATNDVEAKHSSLTAYFGDSKELYTNPRELVRSKTGHEVPTTAQVTYKTPFNLQQAGTRNVVVTTTYQNGVSKDVTTPYTVLDFIGKQDKKINQNQSGQLGDARNYVTVSDNSAVPSELTVRWKGGSSTVDTSAAGVQHKEIEILRGNHLMKTVNIPVEIIDNIKPTITAPDNITLTRLEGLPSELNIQVKDNDKGVGLKDGNPVTVENLPAPLTYNAAKSKIEINGVIPNNFQLGKSSIQVTVKAVDKKGNTATKNITFNIQSQTQKYTAVANPQKQEVSYAESPDAGTSIQKNGLPAGTRYGWATAPNTTTGPGDKTGVVTVTYPDGSTDTVNVTVKVRKLSDEHEPTGSKITVNQNDSVTNDRLKSAVTVNNGGTSKVKSVTASPISTVHAGPQTIKATVTYLDNTTDPVDIPLEVKDVTAPTIQTPLQNQTWEITALDKTLPPIKVAVADNPGGSGVQSITVTDLPDFLTYDDATKTIKFKADTQEVPKLPVGTDSQTHTATIRVTDNANNSSTSQLTFTVKSMTTKYDATANPQKQTVSYGETPDAGTSVNKTNLPEGTSYAWKTIPSTTTPGEKDGVVEVIYKDGSKDTVDVKVTVKELSSEYEVTGAPIEVNQNDPISNDDLKEKVTATSTVGNANGTDKISSVEPKSQITTTNYGDQNITATVTFKDGTTKEVTIPLKVKDVTKPTIQTPAENTNWEMTALDKALPNMEVRAEDNANGSGIKNVTVTGLPDYLEYDSTTNTIKFKSGKQAVEKLPENTPSQEFTLNIRAEDKVGNVSERTAKITVSSMSSKKDPTPIPQNTSYGQVPAPNASVDKAGLPDGTKVTWETPPVVTVPGTTTGVVEVTYPDGSKDIVTVNVTVRKVSEDFTATGTQIEVNQNVSVTPEMLKGAVIATNAQGEKGNAKIATVESKTPINTEAYGDQTIQAKVTYIDGSEQDVTIPLKVKDVTDPTISAPAENTNWEMTALDKTLPSMKIEAKDNANGSGVATIEVNNMPSFLTFDQASGTIVFKEGVREVPRIDSENVMYGVTIVARDKAGNSTSKLVNITVSSMRGKYSPTAIAQEVDNGHVPDPETSVNKTGLPDGTTVTWKTRPDVSTPGSHPGVALVHYPDGTEDEVEVPVRVKEQKETFNPTAKEPNQTVRHNEVPDPEKSINTNDLPKGTNYSWSEQPDTSKPGSKTGKVLITYPDHSTEEVTVTVNVTPQKDEYTPTGIPQEVDNGHVPDPETSVNKTGLPEGTTVTWKETPVVNTPGSHPSVALVHYPDGTVDEVTVPITVKEQKDTFNPTAKEPNQTVRHNEVPDPEKSINTNDLPKGTNYSWSEQPDTSKPGSKTGKVLITYPDHSTEEVTVTVEVTPQKDDYDPQPKAQTVEHAQVPSAKDSIENVKTLPEGTTFGWKDGKIPDTSKHGEKKGVVTVTYPDGSTEDVDVVITVNPEDFSPVVPMEKVPVKNPENLSPEEQDKVKEKVTKANPGKDVTVDSKGNVTITDPETKVSHEISRDKLVFAYAKGEPETSEKPEFNGGVNAPDSPIHEVPEFAGGVNGEPETQEILPEFNGGANTPNSPTHEVPEFNGGVNGELPNPVEVSKIQLMITKWVDENGKELKPADAKAPKVLGEANEAFEHGEIEGYVFVRTETKGDVVTHIFRKVSPVRPTGDGQQRPVTPSDDTNPRPDIATPAEVPATQPTGQPSQTAAVPAQLQNEVSETNPSDSQLQAVLPNTGTKEDPATGALGALSLLGAFGLLFAKKKKDDEEES